MIIGIDGNEANVKNRVGIGEYAYELLKQFVNLKSQISNLKFSIYLKDNPIGDLPKEDKNWQYRIVKPNKLWTQIGLPFDLYFHRPKPDVFFTPTHYAPRFCPVPTVISIMDLSYIHFPQMFKKSDLYQLKNWTAYSIKNAKKVFTISNFSKDDIIKEYNIPEEKIVVTYPGIKLKTHPPAGGSSLKNQMQNLKLLQEKYGVSDNFILFVGTLQPRKNITKLIEAFSKLSKDNSEMNLIIVGKKGWLYEEILKAPQIFGISGKVKFLKFITDEELAILYKNALCFVLPSLYEGFGLPVLEAMSHGCPVVTSNISSLPEVGGNAALYCNPNDADDIAEKINLVVKDKKLRKMLIEKGYNQIKKFNWETTARQTLEVLEEFGGAKR